MGTQGGAPTTPGLSVPVLLLEREREIASLIAAAETAAGGGARVVVVEGPAGIGKSRLLAALREGCAERGLRVLSARGSELELEFPFGVVRQLFEPALVDAETGGRWLSGAAAPAGAVFSPPGEAGVEGRDASFAALHGLFWLTANAAGDAPLVLMVDDLHWVDTPSLRYLAYLVRRLEGMPVLLAVGLRSGERGADPALIGEIVQEPGAVAVRPGPLSDGAARALVSARLGQEPDPAFLAACHEATGGNPLLLGQLLRSLGDDAVRPDAANAGLIHEVGPAAIARTILLRLSRLPATPCPRRRPSPCWGRTPTCPPSPRWPGWTSRGSRQRSTRWGGRRSSARSAPSTSSIRWCGRWSTATWRSASGRSFTRRPRASSPPRAPPPSGSRRTCCWCRRAATRMRWRPCARRQRRRPRGVRPSRRWRCCAAPSRSPRPRGSAPRCCSSWAWSRARSMHTAARCGCARPTTRSWIRWRG